MINNMTMEIKRGYKDGKYNEANTLKYSNITIENVVAMLEDMKERYINGIVNLGTEVAAIKVNSWIVIIKSAKDFDTMLNEYKQYS